MSVFTSILGLFGSLFLSRPKSQQDEKREDYLGMERPDNLIDAARAPFDMIAAAIRDAKYPMRASGDVLAAHLRWREQILTKLPSRRMAWVEYEPTATEPSSGTTKWSYVIGGVRYAEEVYQRLLRAGGVGAARQHPDQAKGCAVQRVGLVNSGMADLIDPGAVKAIDRLSRTNFVAIHQNLPIVVFNGMVFRLESDWNRWLDAGRDADGWTFDTLGQVRNPSAIGGEMLWSILTLVAPIPKQRLLGRFLGFNRHPRLWGVKKDHRPKLIEEGFHVFLTADAGHSNSTGFFTDGLWGWLEHGGAAYRFDNLNEITENAKPQFIIDVDEDSGVTHYHIQGSDNMSVQSDAVGDDHYARAWLSFVCNHSKLSEEVVFTPIGGKDMPFEELTHGWPPVVWTKASAAYGV